MRPVQSARPGRPESAVDLHWLSDQRSRIRFLFQKDEVLETFFRPNPGHLAFFGVPDPDVPVLQWLQVDC